MSIDRLSDPHSPLARFYGAFPESCSYCGQPLTDPTVHWHTLSGVKLWLHPSCAHTLALNLLFDAERALRLVKGQHPLAGVDRAFYRARGPPRPP